MSDLLWHWIWDSTQRSRFPTGLINLLSDARVIKPQRTKTS